MFVGILGTPTLRVGLLLLFPISFFYSPVPSAHKYGHTPKYGRTGFRRIFAYDGQWRARPYANKKVEAIAAQEPGGWLVLTVLVKFF